MRDQPEQKAPPAQRLRVRYAKRGRLRFASHRDFSRALERALVRGGVPMAYSSGFNPHPRISYAGAAPTGSASEAEYLELGLAEEVDPDEVRKRLDEALPAGLDVLEVRPASGGALADRLEASHWLIRLPDTPPDALAAALEQFLAAGEVPVERMTKRGLRRFDCRGPVVVLRPAPAEFPGVSSGCAIIKLVLRHGTPSVRPDDVLAGIREISGLELGAALYERQAQGPLDERTGTVGDPLAPDRDAV